MWLRWWLMRSFLLLRARVMSNLDYLCYIIYMFADYVFHDATLVNHRIDIYNESNEVLLSIHVNAATPDSTEIFKANTKGSVEAVNTMNTFIDFLRMIHDTHDHPFDVINRLVSINN